MKANFIYIYLEKKLFFEGRLKRIMEFRKSKVEDITEIMRIIKEAQEYFKSKGIDQWQDGYPNEDNLKGDISADESYVMLIDAEIVGTAAISFRGESTYDKIYEGEWLSDRKYGVVHRVAVSNEFKGQGISHKIMKFSEDKCKELGYSSIKIDTHKENFVMRGLLEKNGFEYCGIILLEDGAERVAYEKLF